MKLIGSLASPYTRKVRIVLAEKKIDYDFEIDNPWKADARAAKLNPLGKVPVLELDDGRTLFDSRVIVGFLDNASPISRLVPAENRERGEAPQRAVDRAPDGQGPRRARRDGFRARRQGLVRGERLHSRRRRAGGLPRVARFPLSQDGLEE